MPLDPATLGRFGIRPEDEFLHDAAPDEPHWNESVFYDWIAGPDVAGHVRIGRMPNQGRAWLWVFLRIRGEWLALERTHLPIAAFGDGFGASLPGLRIERTVEAPLLVNHLRVAGTARRVTGPRAGALEPFAIDLRFESVGPAHSLGEQTIAGHSTDSYSSNRYEQPVIVRGTHRVGDEAFDVDGHGERDHSWGPRHWNMEWYFLVLHGATRRVQTARVVFDEDAYVAMGYHHDDTMVNVVDNTFELRFDDDTPRRPFEGRVTFTTEDDRTVAGRVEVIDACPIDANHCFDPPQPSRYVRALVRFHPDDGGEVLPGWLEVNRFLRGIDEVGFP